MAPKVLQHPSASGAIRSAGIPADLMGGVFPFHIAFGADKSIIQCGPALNKICPGAMPGVPIDEVLRIVTPPQVSFDLDSLRTQLFTVFFVDIVGTQMRLKGQMIDVPALGNDVMLFLCTPVVRDLESIAQMGLAVNDFAIHDASVDFLILLQTKTNTINDVRKMADRLKHEVQVRRDAEKALTEMNEELEERVIERTGELAAANRELEGEIAERKRTEEALQVANIELKASIRELELRNRQISLLNRMGDMLQACRGVKETYAVIADSAQQLFPHDAGALFLAAPGDDTFRQMSSWGRIADSDESFGGTDCWALRRGRMHMVEAASGEVNCAHLPGGVACGYICAPLTVRGEVLGVLHLRCDQLPSRREREFQSVAGRQHLIQTAAEHISLSIANLRLQEHLRQQSIRDVLTGLYNRRHMEEALEREILRARRHGTRVGVIMTDVDHFKKFNDTYGHQAGDALLRELGRMLRNNVREEDIACRYGGEEFLLILPGADEAIMLARAEHVREQVERTLKVEFNGSYLPQVTLSLGVAIYPVCADAGAELVKAADAALYVAKQQGRNQVCFARPDVIAAAQD